MSNRQLGKSISRGRMAFLAMAMTFPILASAQVASVGANKIYETGSASLWIVAPTGKVSFCLTVQNQLGIPQSKCNVIGSLGAPASNFVISPQPSFFAFHTTTGAIVSCTVVLSNGTNPIGGCAVISSFDKLQ